MGKQIIITESEKKHIQRLYEVDMGLPYESVEIEKSNPFRNPKYQNILDNRVVFYKGRVTRDLESPKKDMIFFVVNMDEILKDRDILLNKILSENFYNKTVMIDNPNINPNKNLFKIVPTMKVASDGFDGGSFSFALQEITQNSNPILIGYTFVFNYNYKTKQFSYVKGVSPAYVLVRDKDGNKHNQVIREDIVPTVTSKIIEVLNNNSENLHQYMGSWDQGLDKYFTIKRVTNVSSPDF